MKFLYIALALSISPALMGMERPPQWPQPKQASAKLEVDKNEKECAICLENMNPGEQYSRFPCNHEMHFECFKTFSKTKIARNHCPLCRAYLPEALLTRLNEKASGTIIGQSNVQNTPNQEVGFLRRMMLMLSGAENNASAPTPEQKIKGLTEALFEAQKRITANQEQIGQLIRQKTNFENKLKETNKEYQEFRLLNPSSAQLEFYKKNVTDLATKNLQLEDTLNAAIAQCEALKEIKSELSLHIAQLNDANYQLNRRIAELQNSNDIQRMNLRSQIENHDALRRKILYAASLGSGIGGYILGSRYVKSYPKVAGLLSGASLLAATYFAGSIYCDDLLRWDRNAI